MFRATERTVTAFSQGVNQSAQGTDKVNAIINCHLATGRIGRPGRGPFSLTGQPNAMGGREAGLLSHQLPGYRTVEDAEHRRAVEDYWKRPPGSISGSVMLRKRSRAPAPRVAAASTSPASCACRERRIARY